MTQNLTDTVEGGNRKGSTLAGANKGELFASFDVDAFEVPGGRDELWRFTPLKRLRGLHDGSAPATGESQIEISERAGVTVESARRGDERLGQAGMKVAGEPNDPKKCAHRVQRQDSTSYDSKLLFNSKKR